ncbi:MAG: histidinol-phosphate transaminase [Dysgonamonadaceae bacterium]|jgi:histidinol-phosphate aminotransferase|nr:histidinol-phosphate transaminase [Dysgonamonadaceae bacterium]
MELDLLVRKCIKALSPYSSARDEYQGKASVFMDANENPYNAPYDRYPDPKQWELKEKIAHLKNIPKEQIMLGNGSDEPIDLLIRIFCEPGVDNIVAPDPTYGMYQVAAQINNVEYRRVRFDENFNLDADKLLRATDRNTKLIYLCSPNNPTGNALEHNTMLKIISSFSGIVIVDEAYIDFSSKPSLLKQLNDYPNLIVLQTFSKAWASAGVRLGVTYASKEIIALLHKVKYPYNINILTQNYMLHLLDDYPKIQNWIHILMAERDLLEKELKALPCVEKVYPSDANFFLVKMNDANAAYRYLVDRSIIVRNRNNLPLCANCIRITVGTKAENQMLIQTLKELKIEFLEQ